MTYDYDPLGRLTSAALGGTTTTYGFDADVNRTSVKVGAGTAATTAYDAADRPTGGADPTASYTSDDDGRLTARPGYGYTWDHLGRLVTVKNAGGTTLATYGYDPLDRLRLVDHGGSDRTRFRYVGRATDVAQWLDDVAGTVTRSVANGWTGERLADWTGSGSNLRIYGTNGHHDVTWLAGSGGTVSAALRYDPWGTPRTTVPTGYTPFRFQGSYLDDTSGLSWVVTRWYANTLGRFISEDSLLGDPADPPSRHLYAYGAGEPVGRWDPDGRYWYRVAAKATLGGLAASRLGLTGRWRMIWNANRRILGNAEPTSSKVVRVGKCLWIPTDWFFTKDLQTKWARTSVVCGPYARMNSNLRGYRQAIYEAQKGGKLGAGSGLFNFTRSELEAATDRTTQRVRRPSASEWNQIASRVRPFNIDARSWISKGVSPLEYRNDFWLVSGNDHPRHCDSNPCTFGQYVFLNGWTATPELRSHEYVHVLQFEGRGGGFAFGYLGQRAITGTAGPSNPEEAIPYLWEAWVANFGDLETKPWGTWIRPPEPRGVL